MAKIKQEKPKDFDPVFSTRIKPRIVHQVKILCAKKKLSVQEFTEWAFIREMAYIRNGGK